MDKGTKHSGKETIKMNGLTISKEDFKALPRAQKDEAIYDNLVYIRTKVTTWRFHLRVQYVLIAALAMLGGFMFRSILKI